MCCNLLSQQLKKGRRVKQGGVVGVPCIPTHLPIPSSPPPAYLLRHPLPFGVILQAVCLITTSIHLEALPQRHPPPPTLPPFF